MSPLVSPALERANRTSWSQVRNFRRHVYFSASPAAPLTSVHYDNVARQGTLSEPNLHNYSPNTDTRGRRKWRQIWSSFSFYFLLLIRVVEVDVSWGLWVNLSARCRTGAAQSWRLHRSSRFRQIVRFKLNLNCLWAELSTPAKSLRNKPKLQVFRLGTTLVGSRDNNLPGGDWGSPGESGGSKLDDNISDKGTEKGNEKLS